MIFRPTRSAASGFLFALLFLLAANTFAAAPTGPTLLFDYGHGQLRENLVSKFMYFVPLISPEPVSVFTDASNAQCARVLSFSSRTNGASFSVTCEFDFTGTGSLQNVFDHTPKIKKHEQELQAGTPLKHQLDSINVLGTGNGSVEIEGVFTNGQRVVNLVELRFNRHGHASPVTINLEDIIYRNGAIRSENEIVARVNSLTFRRSSGTPKMEVGLASLKSKDAGDGMWQNFMGSLKGATANLFLPPLKVEPEGQQAMLDFGLALATGKPDFTFPIATRLKENTPAKL